LFFAQKFASVSQAGADVLLGDLRVTFEEL
jgi:hypothetical protein